MESDHILTEAVDPSRSEPVQFSLRAVFLATTVVCVMLAPAHWLGATYTISAIIALLLVAICSLAYRFGRFGFSLGIAFVGIVLGILTMSTVIVTHAILITCGCLVCGIWNERPRTFASVLLALTAIVYGYVIFKDGMMIRRLAALTTQYPFESMEKRLAFEQTSRSPSLTANAANQQLSLTVLQNLDEMENQNSHWGYRRVQALRGIHERKYQQFRMATDFGPRRMPKLSPDSIELDPMPSIRVPIQIWNVSIAAQSNELDDLHRNVASDFSSTDRIGYVRNRKEVAGFESHGFSNLETSGVPKSDRWQISRLELVGLLRHDEPRVYVSSTLPQMDELEKIPHRPLNPFEKASLPKLQFSDDLVFNSSGNRIVMLGAVRAGNDCLQCHEGERGKLLGAFSYELERVK